MRTVKKRGAGPSHLLMTPDHAGNVVGVDPHKRTLTATVADARGGIVASAHFRVSGEGHRELEAWARQFGQIARWGVEGSASWGRHTAMFLAGRGHDVRDVCPNRTPRSDRARQRGKSDMLDSERIAREVLAHSLLPKAFKRAGQEQGPDEQHQLLALWNNRRRSILTSRQHLVGEAEYLLCELPLELREQLPDTKAKVKNDQFDARTLAELLAADLVPRVWIGDEQTRVLRRLTSRRTQLVRARTRPKNEISAVLVRNLKGRPPMTDVFGKQGRVWLSGLELPADEQDTVQACLRQIDFLTTEISHVDRQLAEHALSSPEIKRLMTIPGVGVTTAATLIAAIGDIHRFPSAKRLVGYLGIDPRVRQSGLAPARQGRISKQGSSSCRHVLVEASWSAIKTPGPLRAFYQRVRARRGAQVAIVATARKLASLCWQLLTTNQDYAFKRQTIVDRKLRALELRAGAPTRHGTQHQPGTTTAKQRALLERQLTEQAELAYTRLIQDWKATGNNTTAPDPNP